MYKILLLILNKCLHLLEVRRVKTKERVIYLTFDDGPEEGITEFVLQELKKYRYKATFFCKGVNAEIYKELFERIIQEGHAIGNHTYNHINGLNSTTYDYLSDIERANTILKTYLFRPPWGAIKFSQFLRLRKKYRIVYWSLVSGDTLLDRFNLDSNIERMKSKTKAGDVVLFHCCKRHETETKQILPLYLEWLNDQGYKTGLL